MALPGYSAGDFINLAKCAWTVYTNVRESRANFLKLNIDVECLLVGVGSLDKGHTKDLVADYIGAGDDESHQREVQALREGLNSVIMPFYGMFVQNEDVFGAADDAHGFHPLDKSPGAWPTTSSNEPITARERPWRRWTVHKWARRFRLAFQLKDMTDLRSRFAVQAANLNLFMTRLTHTQLQRQTELLCLKSAEQSSLLGRNFNYSTDLIEASIDFRQDVGSYVKFLLDGGKPLSNAELQVRKAETVFSSVSRPLMNRPGQVPYRQGRPDPRARYREEEEVIFQERIRTDDSQDRVRMYEWEREREREKERQYQRMAEEQRLREDPSAVVMDDDARLKLAAARQRLARDDMEDYDNEDDFDENDENDFDIDEARSRISNLAITGPPGGSIIGALPPAPSRRRPTSLRSVSEQIIIPSPGGGGGGGGGSRIRNPSVTSATTAGGSNAAQQQQQQQQQPIKGALVRRASAPVTCNNCRRSVEAQRAFYRCETGQCGRVGDTYDVCRRCYVEAGIRCPGFDKGWCMEMHKFVWADID